jgi:hypothetical protein
MGLEITVSAHQKDYRGKEKAQQERGDTEHLPPFRRGLVNPTPHQLPFVELRLFSPAPE